MDPLMELVGESPPIVAVRDQIRRLLRRQADARRLAPVLIQGETGTGKGLVGRAMHTASVRASGPFVDVNCAAIPGTLLEAEMFGVERGAFTDARQARPGLFQLAHQGTIFLDEIGLLPEALQAKLLKVIEDRSVRRLGGTRSELLDVWIIAATNDDLDAAVRSQRFRADLYHRLAVVTFALPPLRDRGDDLLRLAEHFLARACADYGLPPKALTPAARTALLGYSWPGNVRELSNVIERVALLCDERQVPPAALGLSGIEAPAATPATPPTSSTPSLEAAVSDAEREHVLASLEATGWNITQTAVRLGISRNTLRYRIRKHDLQPETARSAGDGAAETGRPAPTATAAAVSAPRERRRLTLLRATLVEPAGSFESPQSGRVLDLLSDKVQSFGGRIEELSGAGIVAVFGLEPVEDAPLRAAQAARAIVNGVERLRRTAPSTAFIKIAIHVDQFSIVPGSDASPIDHQARPHAWALLDRLISTLPSDGIVASDTATPFLQRRFHLVPGPALEDASGRGWRLTGLEEGRLTTFVGRHHELELLSSRFQSTTRRQGQIVGIVGDAGIGKSRVLFELRQSLAGQPVTFVEGHCHSYGAAVPYLPVLDIVNALCGLVDTDAPEEVESKLNATLDGVGIESSEAAPYLLHLLGHKEGAKRLVARSPEEIKTRTFEALNRVLARASARQPLVIVVEDLHWIDPTSEEYLAKLADTLAAARILLVATYRSGYRASWIDRSYATQMALQPLGREHARSVVTTMLGPGEVEDSLVEQILAKAEGNPFFLEELARAVRERGDASPHVAVPDTVQEVVLARINRLPVERRGLLQAAAVIGKDVSRSLLGAISDLSESKVGEHLNELTASEFLITKSAPGEAEYAFKHALTHEVAYHALEPDRRRALHAAIVQVIETRFPGRLVEHVDRLSRHAFLGEIWDKALVYQRQAGAKAVSRSAHSEAVVCFARALEAIERVPEGRERTEQAVDLHLLRANSLVPIAELSPISDHLRQAERLAQTLGDHARIGRVSSFLSAYSWLIGDHAVSVEHGGRALDIATKLNDLTLRVRTTLGLGQTYHVLGDYRKAIEVLGHNVDALQGELLGRRFGLLGLASVLSRAWQVWCLAELGEFERALPLGEEGIRIAETVGDPYSILAAYFGVGGLHLRRGERDRAVAVLERAFELCQTWDTHLRLWFMGVAPSLGHAYALAGKPAQAIPLLEQAMARAASTGLMFAQPIRVGWLAHAYLQAGRTAEAKRLAAEALALARRHRERGHEAWAQGIIGDIAAHPDQLDAAAAESAYHEAMLIAEELGMRPRVALGHLGLGRLYRRTGKEAQAAEHLATAAAMLRAMRMPLWLEEAEAELRHAATK